MAGSIQFRIDVVHQSLFRNDQVRNSERQKRKTKQPNKKTTIFSAGFGNSSSTSVCDASRQSGNTYASPHFCAATSATPIYSSFDELLSDDERPLNPKPEWKFAKKAIKDRKAKAEKKAVALEAAKKLEWLDKQKVDFNDERTIARVNRTISQAASVKEALQIVEEMKAAGMNAANEGTFVALITVCRRQKQGERGLIVYEAMKQSTIKPGLWTYNALISCCQQAKKLEAAFKLKEEMETAGISPNVVTYTALMALVIRSTPYRGRTSPAQRFETANKMLEEMLVRQIQPDVVTINTLLYGAAKAKLPDRVMEVYGKMSSLNITPDSQTFRILLECVSKSGRLQSCLEVFNEMKALGLQPKTSTFNMLIEACGNAPQPDSKKAWELYEELVKSPMATVTAETMNLLLSASFKAKDHKGAIRAFNLTKDIGFLSRFSTTTFNKLILSAEVSSTLESAFEMLAEMESRGCVPDVVTLGTLVNLCGKHGDVERALAVVAKFDGLGIKADPSVYRALIGMYGKADQWEKAVATFRDMEEAFPEDAADLASYSAVFDACIGPEGVDKYVGMLSLSKEEGQHLNTSAGGLVAAVELYHEGCKKGLFDNFSETDLGRCDVREMSKASAMVCIVAWLEALKSSPVHSDVVVVTGSDKGRAVLGKGRGRYPKLYVTAQRVLLALGLEAKNFQALTMQALTVEKEKLDAWLLISDSRA